MCMYINFSGQESSVVEVPVICSKYQDRSCKCFILSNPNKNAVTFALVLSWVKIPKDLFKLLQNLAENLVSVSLYFVIRLAKAAKFNR